jgi:predicted ArsR family transcriptional regulator
MDDLISTADAAEILGVTPRAVRRYHADGVLQGREIAGTLLFLREDVKAFVKPTMGRPPKAEPAPVVKAAKGKKGGKTK